MAQACFVFDLNKCTGCQACVIACEIENHPERLPGSIQTQARVNRESISPGQDGMAGPSWRDVHTYNQAGLRWLPAFSLSQACHHCLNPACLVACPSRAYRKDRQTGAVMLDPDRCLGCKYCNWACPYAAPRYNLRTGVVEKCTFCLHRLAPEPLPADNPVQSGTVTGTTAMARIPATACVAACPTGALQVGDYFTSKDSRLASGGISGELLPAVRFIPLRSTVSPLADRRDSALKTTSPATGDIALPSLPLGEGVMAGEKPVPRLALSREWPLLVFTSLLPLLVAVLATEVLAGESLFTPALFLGTGLAGLGISLLHLGKPQRLYRAVTNWRTSWLSREVGLTITFLVLSGVYFLMPIWPKVDVLLGWLAFLIGLAALFAVDRTYRVLERLPRGLGLGLPFALFFDGLDDPALARYGRLERRGKRRRVQIGRLSLALPLSIHVHSASVLLTGLYLSGLLGADHWYGHLTEPGIQASAVIGSAWLLRLFYLVALAKLLLYLSRHLAEWFPRKPIGGEPSAGKLLDESAWIAHAVRTAFGLFLPALFVPLGIDVRLVLALALLGELIDRAEFYAGS